ncbi:MAG TPA: hypothetical protein VFO90_01475 [Terrimicrobiaceae bacterium]|nr:hypothetical protein [Terrimicrobiaceae bacterium]
MPERADIPHAGPSCSLGVDELGNNLRKCLVSSDALLQKAARKHGTEPDEGSVASVVLIGSRQGRRGRLKHYDEE